jgi:Cys-tRNA(Pro) deacylase
MGDKYFQQQPDELKDFIKFLDEDIENVKRAIDFCESNDLDVEFKVHGKSETAEESASKTDIELDQIVKTLVFKAGKNFIAVLCPGDKRVDEKKLEDFTGEKIEMASPSEVKEKTGYIVGGVSPFDLNIQTCMEQSLLEKQKVKPAAGSKVIGATLDPKDLKKAIKADTARLV